MYLSTVTMMYQSAPYLQEFYERMSAAAGQITQDYELIFVNDGSPDESLEVALSLYRQDERVRLVDLSRNFGHHKAMMTGLAHARGEWIFLIDCDLEEDPGLLSEFYNSLQKEDADVVFGVQGARKGGFFEQVSGHIFYKLFNLLSTDPIPENQVTVRLMSRRYLAALLEHRERELMLAGVLAATGFRQIPVTVDKKSKGSTAYSLASKVSLFVNAVTSFSSKPLVLVFYLGAAIVTAASIAAVWLIVRRLFFRELLAGWPSLIVSIWLLGGLTIFCVGLIGIYLSKVFMETKQRPLTVITQVHERATEFQ